MKKNILLLVLTIFFENIAILLLTLTISCENITPDGLYNFSVYKYENEEVICYSSGYMGGLSCKFKESK